MSTAVMAACWPLRMPPTAKSVLISLADNANDAGYCWPSIDTISERTCYSRRAVIDAIAWLERAGALVADRSNGRHTSYRLTVNSYRPETVVESPRTASRRAATSADAAPVSDRKPVQMPHQCGSRTGANAAQTSADAALDQCGSRTLTVNEPSEPSIRKETRAPARPVEVPAQIWSDWLAVRKAKRAALTETALAGVRREADKAGLTLADALAVCCERSWVGFRADWYAPGAARASPNQSAADARRKRESAFIRELTGRQADDREVIDVQPQFARIA